HTISRIALSSSTTRILLWLMVVRPWTAYLRSLERAHITARLRPPPPGRVLAQVDGQGCLRRHGATRRELRGRRRQEIHRGGDQPGADGGRSACERSERLRMAREAVADRAPAATRGRRHLGGQTEPFRPGGHDDTCLHDELARVDL